MTDSNNTGDKTISAPPKKTLGLKGRTERDTVRQSFSHGRTNMVQVERKKRRVVLPGEAPAKPEPAVRPLASAGTSPTLAPEPVRVPPPPQPSRGMVLN